MAHQEDYLLEKAMIAAREKEFDRAAQLLKSAILLTPLREDLHYQLGNVLTALGDTEKAVDSLQHALDLNKQYPEAHNNLGRIFHKQSKFEKAYFHYQSAIQYRKHYIEAELNLGFLWVKEGQIEKAKKQFQSILSWNPSLPVVYEQLAQIALREGNVLEAQHYYEKRLDTPILSADTYNNIGAVFSRVKDYKKALDAFTKALKLESKHVEARNNRAAIYLEQHLLKEAIWEYGLYLRLAPSDEKGYYNLGVALMLSGRLEESIDAFKKVVDLSPHYLDAWCNLGAIYLQKTQLELAFDAYQTVLSMQPGHATAQFMASALSQSELLKRTRSLSINIPEVAPQDYVKGLFDYYAESFEKHLKQLDYKIPQKLYDWVKPHIKDRKLDILDLGCGTGLLGEVFQPYVRQLKGVDLSEKMLKEAEKKSVYHDLVEKDILIFLKEEKRQYDLILSADTLVYFGSLEEMIYAVLDIARPGAYFAFSVESTPKDSSHSLEKGYYRLQVTGRYQHSLEGVRKIAEQCGWQWVGATYVKGRVNQHQPVTSGLCLLRKPS